MLVTSNLEAAPLDDAVDALPEAGAAAGAVVELDEVVHEVVHVQLRPRLQVLAKCLGELEAVLRSHPAVKIDVAGIGRNDHQFLLTLGIDAGPRKEIPKFGPSAVAAFELTNAVFSLLADYMPRYTSAPAAHEVTLAADLPNLLELAATATATATGGALGATAG